MTFTKEDLFAAFAAGMEYNHTWEHFSKEKFPAEFETWYAAKFGERDKRIADAEWSKRMDDANRAAGVDLL
jgi:hypothetical protein